MSRNYLVHRHPGQSFLFRSTIPKDLQDKFGQKQFQLSLRCGLLKQARSLAQHLYNLTQQLYQSLRQNSGPSGLNINQIKLILRTELDRLKQLVPITTLTQAANPELNKPPIINDPAEITLSELSDRFIKSRQDRGFGAKTIADYLDSNNLLIEVFGDIKIDDLTHQHGRDYIEILKGLPPNRRKHYPNKSIKQLLRMKNLKILSYRTITKHVERVSAWFNWAIKQGYVQQNVFRGKLEPPRVIEEHEKHFTQNELDLILGDCLAAEANRKGRLERYWVPMIAAYSGARLNEICQLDVEDIRQQNGTWVMDIQPNAKDKNVKNRAGNRLVPLHSKLIRSGLLDYVQQVKDSQQKKLFPNLKQGFRTTYGDTLSKWFARYLVKLGIKKKGKNFHSFRHTVINQLLTSQVYEPFIKELVGHSNGSITVDVYGGKKPLDVLLTECVEKL